MITLQTLLYKTQEIPYDGTPLAPHWIYRKFDLLGDALVAFIGPAIVPTDHMVDLEDVKNNAPIRSPKMLHFLGEWFIDSLEMGILLQNFLVANVYQRLWEKGVRDLSRRGNDLFYDRRKLSVSIATRSSVSVLVHLGINVETQGTPIPTAGLQELWLDPWELASEVLEKFQQDIEQFKKARAKVLAR
ncbi:MAG: DUF366 family protein [Proteobacteria bacterium]|nr:DUF366 family protein [Pseudomonadota bacterium]NDC25198.1 DUF366 family protein [Pseudomonadota bacterium]NDD05455.1 DUF366 family protein [Pseudomonadota bacterium]NDG27901.1 DUF366 family protein [Pseudomonadota bacterium]